jgi:NADH dehydrogenase [ubiquinone] 1 alpha subcomplex assembly factor 1
MTLFVLALGTLGTRGVEEGKEEKPMNILMQFDESITGPKWVAVNDGVMGGLSEGRPAVKNGSLFFTGKLSLENNGGFSSVRVMGAFDFGGKTAMILRVRGDGRTYQLRLSTEALHNGSPISYGASFPTEAGKWMEVKIPFQNLSPSWRGQKLEGPPLALGSVKEIGILIGDKKAGFFALEIDWVAVE